MTKLAERLSAYASNLRYEDLRREAIHEVKRRLLDTLGCALGAFQSRPATIAREIATTVSSNQPATIIGTRRRSSPELAAFANGVAFRYLDYNDTYLSKEPAHPSDNFAAVLAAGESEGAGGREIITASVLAYEIQCRLCDAASLRARGWDHVTYGAFSTALAAGKLFGLDPDQLAQAVALAGTPNNALRQTRVGMLSEWKGCAFANASRNGVFAALLARYGMTGPPDVFEGEMGFWKQVSGPFELAELGEGKTPFRINSTYIKRYPAEYHSQSAIEAALSLRDELESVDEVDSVTIDTFRAAVEIIGGEPEKWRPTTRETADHSLPYCTAVALLDGEVTLGSFDTAHLNDPRVHALLDRTEVRADPELDRQYPEGIPNRVTVRTKSGKELCREVTYPRGHAKNPMEDSEVEAKFRSLVAGALPQSVVQDVIRRTWTLDQHDDVGAMLRLLAVQS